MHALLRGMESFSFTLMLDQSKEQLFGYQIPMPRSELLIAVATVISFLPVIVILYHTAIGVYHLVKPKRL